MPRVGRASVVLQRSIGHLWHLFGFFTFGLRLDLVHLLYGLEHLKQRVKGKQATPGHRMRGCEEQTGASMQGCRSVNKKKERSHALFNQH